MLCAHSWLQQAIMARREHLIVVVDEPWRVLQHLHVARWLRASWKMSRAWRVCNIAVIHRLSDLAAAGDARSEQRELTRGLLADTETRVIYRQPEDVRDERHAQQPGHTRRLARSAARPTRPAALCTRQSTTETSAVPALLSRADA